MAKNYRTATVIKGQISKFSGIISRDLPKPKQKLVRKMIYGIQTAKDIKLSNITRCLNEPIALIKTEDRLSRNLDDRDFTDEINHEIGRLASIWATKEYMRLTVEETGGSSTRSFSKRTSRNALSSVW